MSEDTYNYKQAYFREKSARDQLEVLLEDKTRALFQANQALEEKLAILKNQQATVMQTDKMATLGTLAAGVAHEINNPLAYVTSNLESIKFIKPVLLMLLKVAKQYADKTISANEAHAQLVTLDQQSDFNFMLDDIDELLDDTHEGLNRIASIVNNLLNFARPQSSAMAIASIKETLDGAVKLLANQLKTSTVSIHCNELPMTYCNLSALNQVFVNLLLNAKYACDLVSGTENEITVNLFAQNDKIYIEVQDNGCGMDEATVNHVFEPFYTTKPVGDGTGMGMAIVYSVLKEHGGVIEIESELNKGTLMRCIIPIMHEHK